jgi:hypothetical protein
VVNRVKRYINKILCIILIAIFLFIIFTQYSDINRYKLWASDDLNNELAGIGIGILSNKDILSDIVQSKEITVQQVEQIVDNGRSIYGIKKLQQFATQILGYDHSEFLNTDQSIPWYATGQLRENVEQLLSQKERLYSNRITLKTEELLFFQRAFELHQQWADIVQNTYPNISKEGASIDFFHEHRDMTEYQIWIPFIKKLSQITLEFNTKDN